MHIPDGFISSPVNIATAVVTAGAIGLAIQKSGKELQEKQVPLLGVTAAFIFAAQMLNFPVLGGTSGHFLGAMLAAVLMGPLNAVLIMALVLIIQCLVFADGGLTALGTNIFNMGVVGGIGMYYVFLALKKVLPSNRTGFAAAVAISSWLSVVVASFVCSLELAFSGTATLAVTVPAMVGVHAIIGVGEAIITTIVVSMVTQTRPDLVSAMGSVVQKPAEVSA